VQRIEDREWRWPLWLEGDLVSELEAIIFLIQPKTFIEREKIGLNLPLIALYTFKLLASQLSHLSPLILLLTWKTLCELYKTFLKCNILYTLFFYDKNVAIYSCKILLNSTQTNSTYSDRSIANRVISLFKRFHVLWKKVSKFDLINFVWVQN